MAVHIIAQRGAVETALLQALHGEALNLGDPLSTRRGPGARVIDRGSAGGGHGNPSWRCRRGRTGGTGRARCAVTRLFRSAQHSTDGRHGAGTAAGGEVRSQGAGQSGARQRLPPQSRGVICSLALKMKNGSGCLRSQGVVLPASHGPAPVRAGRGAGGQHRVWHGLTGLNTAAAAPGLTTELSGGAPPGGDDRAGEKNLLQKLDLCHILLYDPDHRITKFHIITEVNHEVFKERDLRGLSEPARSQPVQELLSIQAYSAVRHRS